MSLSQCMFLAAGLAAASRGTAQQPANWVAPLRDLRARDATAGSPQENTLLILNLLSRERTLSSIRPLSRVVLTSVAASEAADTTAARHIDWSMPLVSAWWNSGGANPDRDGVVWQGKGATAAVSGGLSTTFGPLSLDLRPIVFSSQNLGYRPTAPGPVPAGDYRFPFEWRIDLPYRFGDKAYSRADWGESSLQLRLGSVALGWSAETQSWGPAHLFPLVASAEAGGFHHVFVGSAKPWNLGITQVAARWELGKIENSRYLGVPERARLTPALVVSVSPAGMPGFEIGGTRVFHAVYTRGAVNWTTAMLPFAGLLKNSDPTNEAGVIEYNQLASVFMKIAPPGAGVEAYGEFYRDDHNVNVRDLVGELDHSSALTVGIRRVWRAEGGLVRSLTIERANARISHLAKLRVEEVMYIHQVVPGGHTNRGQPLGSSIIPGGGGTGVRFDVIGDEHASSVSVEHRGLAQNREGGSWNGTFTGEYVGSFTRTKLRKRWSESWTMGLRHGYGLAKADALNTSVTLRWR